MGTHVVIGTGQIGGHVARLLAADGHDVVVVTRSGTGPEGTRRVALDAASADGLTRAAEGADALYNCANPPYHRWPQEWPPLAAAALRAAEKTGAVLVNAGNLYAYGPVDGPMTESLPLAATETKGRVRARIWAEALAAHEAGRARVTEARSSDYFGPGATDPSLLNARFMPPLLAGRPIRVTGDPDAPHTWTYLPDAARAMITLATDPRAWGRAWHVPSPPPRSIREMARLLAREAGAPEPRVSRIPRPALRLAALASPLVREVLAVSYQVDRPFVADSSAFTGTFGQEPAPLGEMLTETVAWWRSRV
ncbi:NAD-dependent epimerase/dehydratase family protein [Bailinhaonella thermotolerans]|uniref:NAD-dependent epimerase/dehydratase family protein n=1 Tax=Bailinhaonella thermotolerans TaxID=1070861 RepID=A0A3A4B287_9ACTN|nr:NAD-dependent epimerase/dehydratase family protein [Bailinhaonella thermotolerans]RJL34278.1 NAD-dependent epimerase/dehydratase family protein [Bailinhaonella thermotolerans]